jgi:hypothetical protein
MNVFLSWLLSEPPSEQAREGRRSPPCGHLSKTRHERRMLSLANERKHAPRARRQRPGSGNRSLSS